MQRIVFCAALILAALFVFVQSASATGQEGYYRHPAIHGDTIVFVAEGDLWRVPVSGGVASRLTTHPSYEGRPAISPDGSRVAFNAQYEGGTEVYSMPLVGGLPARHTFEGQANAVAGFTPEGKLLIASRAYSGLRDYQLVSIDLDTNVQTRIPLAQAWEGTVAGSTLFFTRFTPQPSNTKRYRGGTAQNVWKFDLRRGSEAELLTADFDGTSRTPMVWENRVYFESDRDGHMNLWSMDFSGSDLVQHTRHNGWDVQAPDLQGGKIVYQLGADLRVYDIAGDSDALVPITLGSDFDQTREKWIRDPARWISNTSIAPDGESAVFTARGQLFVIPRKHGRIARPDGQTGTRYRAARYDFNGKRILALGDATGEVEIWSLSLDGLGEKEQITDDAHVLRWYMVPSPDSAWIAHYDKDQELWMLNRNTGRNQRIDESSQGGFFGLVWSPHGRYLAYVKGDTNLNSRIWIHDTKTGKNTPVTTDRFNSTDPQWSADGQWLYFVSDRHVRSLVRSVWGPRQPEPFFDRADKLMMLALQNGLVSPFEPETELLRGKEESEESEADQDKTIEFEGIHSRLSEVPVDPGNYSNLMAGEDRLFWLSMPDRHSRDLNLMTISIGNDDPEAKELAGGVTSVELSEDREQFLIRKGGSFYIADAGGSVDLSGKTSLDLSNWSFTVQPRQEWEQMFVDAWRMHRDYFYDTEMHGVDWQAMLAKYQPLVSRVSDRQEFANLLGQMVAELTALHSYVYGGDHRSGNDNVGAAALGALLERNGSGGYRVELIYESDPDEPWRAGPLTKPGVDIVPGDVIVSVNAVETAGAPSLSALLRNTAGTQVLLEVLPQGSGEPKKVVVEPITSSQEAELRYHQWEYTRRLEVEEKGSGELGYIHLRAMGGNDIDQFGRDFYPVFKRKGLIVDARHNGGGNIESWILEKLSRRPWMFWAPRKGVEFRNMQYAFIGHMVLLMDERTVSDGEVFAEGFRRLGLGKLIGTRTMGGEIWISSSNRMVDRGIAVAPEFGVYGPEGEWLIENYGVDPDIEVDNLPHATFNGRDAQLEAAIKHLQQLIAEQPLGPAPVPEYPDKSSEDNRSRK